MLPIFINKGRIRSIIRNIIQESFEKCSISDLTQEIKDEITQYNTSEELLRAGGISIDALDRAAHGFSESDITQLNPDQLNIKWKEDRINVVWEQEKSGLEKIEWANTIDISEPIDVSFENGKFYIEDGHHRHYAASILGKQLNVELKIKSNPMLKLAPELSYDDFHRCVFDTFIGK